MIKKLLRYLVKENSAYLFSGFCMLYGVYLLMGNAPVAADKNIWPDLSLLGTMKVYEVMVTLFAVVVFRRLRIENDGLLLSCIAVILYLDPTLFNTRFSSAGTMTGLAVNGGCLALAVGGLALLSRVGGLPITFAGARGVAVGAAGIYLSASFLDSEFSPLTKNAAPSQDHLYYLLWLLPLAAALAARKWFEAEVEPRQMRHHYLNTVLTYAPFALLVRHLYVMQGVYETHMFAANYAPVLLGVAVLIDKTFVKLRSSTPLLFVGLGWFAVMLSSDSTALARVTIGNLQLTPVHLMATLTIAAALWLWADTGRRTYAYYALFAVSPLISGSCDILEAALSLRASFIIPLWIVSLVIAYRSRAFGDVVAAGWISMILAVRSMPVSNATAVAAVSHGAIWWLIIVGKQYQKVWVDECTAQLAGYLMGTTFMALHAFYNPPLFVLPYLALQVALFFAMGRRRNDETLRNAASAFGGLELSIRCYNNAQQVDLVAIARSFGGVGMMALAFVGLFAGVWVSFNKDRLLAWLGDDDTAA